MTINDQICLAHFGAEFQSKPCVLCGEITYLTARMDREEIYLCKKNGHWSKEGLRQALEKERRPL